MRWYDKRMNQIQKVVGFIKKYWWAFTGAGVALVMLVVLPSIIVNLATRSGRYNITQINQIPSKEYAIIFGAGVRSNGEPTPYLKWRIETGVDLYKAGRVKKLHMSGDNSRQKYNEPEAMRRYAEQLGVKPEDITMDYAGFNTYDSCYRAKHVFHIDSAILVTQGYHLPRAEVTCNGLGVQSIGMGAKKEGRDFTAAYIFREMVATDKALLQITFKPHPTVL